MLSATFPSQSPDGTIMAQQQQPQNGIEVTPEGIRTIRDCVMKDPVALEKWGLIIDNLVETPGDALRMKSLLSAHQYGEAVLKTIELWTARSSSNVFQWDELMHTLERHGLRRLAGVLRENQGEVGVWIVWNTGPEQPDLRDYDLPPDHFANVYKIVSEQGDPLYLLPNGREDPKGSVLVTTKEVAAANQGRQRWHISKHPQHGFYYVTSAFRGRGGMLLALDEAYEEGVRSILVWPFHGKENQQWELCPAPASENSSSKDWDLTSTESIQIRSRSSMLCLRSLGVGERVAPAEQIPDQTGTGRWWKVEKVT